MSRIGKQTIQIPAGVTVEVKENVVRVKGPKGELHRPLPSALSVRLDAGALTVLSARNEEKKDRALWGTYASHIKNMVVGAAEGFQKQMEVNGVGFRVAVQGKDLRLEVGFSHPVLYAVPDGIKAAVEKNVITIAGADKELVGRVATEIRGIRKPEPYKGKGIQYVGEVIRRKAGKAAKAAAA